MIQQSDWPAEREAIRARLEAATPGPWTHFYPEHREAKSGVIRPPAVHDLVIGNVTIDGGSASGLRYQVEGYGKVNGQDRYSIATISPPRPRNTSDWDGIGKEASALAFKHVEADGELIAHAPEDLRRLLDRVDEVEREIERLRGHIANYTVRVNEPQNEAGETAVEPEDIIYALRAELASRKQRISELERRLRIPFGKFPCAQCGGPHDFDTSIPSVIWNDVIRAKSLPEYLCTTCIVREFVRAGRSFTAQLWNEEFNGASVEFIVNGQNAQDAAAIQDENNRLRNELAVLRKANEEVWEQAIQRLKGSWSTDMGNDWNGAINKAIGIVEAARSGQSD